MRFSCVLFLLYFVVPNESNELLDDSQEIIECKGGYCLPKLMCPQGTYQELNNQNTGLIILRIGEEDECLDYMRICCKNETEIVTNRKCPAGYCVSKDMCPRGRYEERNVQNLELVVLKAGPEEDACLDHMQICCPSAGKFGAVLDYDDPSPACGLNNPDGLVYRVESNRTYAQYGEFPWMVAILKTLEGSTTKEYVGAGSLIHPRFVLSVAHHFKSGFTLVARFGEWDIDGNENYFPVEDINILPDILIHPEYSVMGLLNDIALARLERDVVYQKHIRPICLPSPSDVFDGQRCISTGWGEDVRTKQYANILKRIDLSVVPRENCLRMLRATRLGRFFQLHKSIICAGGETGADMCDGDGGSPLACPTDAGTYVLAGIVSWGVGCNQNNVPGGYVNVALFADWIQSTLDAYNGN